MPEEGNRKLEIGGRKMEDGRKMSEGEGLKRNCPVTGISVIFIVFANNDLLFASLDRRYSKSGYRTAIHVVNLNTN